MSDLLETVQRWFADEEWGAELLPDGDVLKCGFIGDNGEMVVMVRIREKARQVIAYSRAPFSVPEDKRSAMAELLTRANYGLLIGNFEMDFADGELRYKTGIDVEGTTLDLALVRHLIYPNVLTMDRYLPAIVSLIYGGSTPEEAIARVEGKG